MVKKTILFISLILFCDIAFASSVCSMVPGGELDKFQSDFYNQAQTFATNVMPTVTGVYWLLFTLWCAWELSFDRLLGFNIDKLYVWWVYRIFVAYIIQHIFLDPSFYVGIIKFGGSIGAKMGNFSVSPDSPNLLGNFTPSAIMGVNNCIATAIETAHGNLGEFNVLGALELFVLQNAFFVVTGMAAFYVLYVSLKMWMSMFAGFVNAMFAGNGWTVSWWQAYLSTVIKYALELMFVAAMFGIISQQMDKVVLDLTGAGADITSHYATYIISILQLGFMTYLMLVVPKELASSLGGTFGGKLIEVGGKLAMRGGGFISQGAGAITDHFRGNNTSPGGGTLTGGAPTGGGAGGGSPPANNPSDWKSGGSTSTQTSPASSGGVGAKSNSAINGGATKPDIGGSQNPVSTQWKEATGKISK